MAPSPPKPEGLDESYPMWVLPVEKLLELQEWKPHQTMLAEGRLVQYKDVPKDSKIIFVSHRMPRRARALACPDTPSSHDTVEPCLGQSGRPSCIQTRLRSNWPRSRMCCG